MTSKANLIHILLLFIFGLSQAQEIYTPGPSSTKIIYDSDVKIFPCKWRRTRTNAKVQAINPGEIPRTNEALVNALNKYPSSLLDKYLKKVYVLKSMNFFDLEYGGTYHKKKIYITNNGKQKGYSQAYIEGTFHHEFSSILLKRNSRLFDRKAWMSANPTTFDYGEGGQAALQTEKATLHFDSTLYPMGFLNQYSLASMEEDFNCFAEYLFTADKEFWNAWEDHEAIRKKTTLIIEFFHNLDHRYTLDFFRKL